MADFELQSANSERKASDGVVTSFSYKLKCQRAAEAWSFSATELLLYTTRPSSFFLRGSSSRFHAASLLAGLYESDELEFGSQVVGTIESLVTGLARIRA